MEPQCPAWESWFLEAGNQSAVCEPTEVRTQVPGTGLSKQRCICQESVVTSHKNHLGKLRNLPEETGDLERPQWGPVSEVTGSPAGTLSETHSHRPHLRDPGSHTP